MAAGCCPICREDRRGEASSELQLASLLSPRVEPCRAPTPVLGQTPVHAAPRGWGLGLMPGCVCPGAKAKDGAKAAGLPGSYRNLATTNSSWRRRRRLSLLLRPRVTATSVLSNTSLSLRTFLQSREQQE